MTAADCSRPKLYTVDEVAGTFRVTRRTVDRWIQDNLIISVKVGGRRLIPEFEIHRLLRST
jgi:excisionase family DNA binding protein